MTETKSSNTPMILGIVGFVASIPGIICATMCAGLAAAGGAAAETAKAMQTGASADAAVATAATAGALGIASIVLYLSLVPSVVGFVFSFMTKSKAKLSGIVLIICAALLLIITIVTFNWIWGMITTICYLIAGILSLKNQ